MSTEDDFSEGYIDGRDPTSPEPSENRSHAYRHGFAVGRRELEGRPMSYWTALEQAFIAEAKDAAASAPA